MNASSVSRALHVAGFRPLPSGSTRNREGLRVSDAIGHVSVVADFDSENESARYADDVVEFLSADYEVERKSKSLVWVKRRKAMIENMHRIEPRSPQYSLYLDRMVLPAKPGGVVANVVTAARIYTVSKLEGETGWTIDGESLANGLPVFFNGEGARYTLLRELADPTIVAALDVAAAEFAKVAA